MVLLSSFISADRIIEFLKMGTLPMTVSWWKLLFSSSDRTEKIWFSAPWHCFEGQGLVLCCNGFLVLQVTGMFFESCRIIPVIC